MGGLISGIAGLIEGNPTAQEQAQLGQIGGYELGQGQGYTNQAGNYYSNLLSGDTSAIAQTLAPQISAQQGQLQNQMNQNAQFGNRAGGTNASNQAAAGQARGNIINAIGGAQQGAAGALGSMGSNLLSQGAGNIGQEANMAYKSNQDTLSQMGGIGQAAAEIAMGAAGGFGGGGGGMPPMIDAGTSPQTTPGADFGPPPGSSYSGSLFGMGGDVPSF
jgi:hypothetical protein